MGEHRRLRLCAIERWLRSEHGESERRTLDHIYSEEYLARWKPRRPLEGPDYVKTIDGKKVYAEVFGPQDDWRGVMGKVVCFAAEAVQAGSEYEVWLLTDFDHSVKSRLDLILRG